MGSLWHFTFTPDFVRQFPIYVETGYGTGNSMEYAVKHDFETLYSIDIWRAAIVHAYEKFANEPRVRVIQDDSPFGIYEILSRATKPMFFWLDAHFPGADCFGQPFDAYEERTRLPLVRELIAINNRSSQPYTILIDDLRYWGKGLPWEHPDIPPEIEKGYPAQRTLDFLEPFTHTHRVEILLNDSGYALISPHGAPALQFLPMKSASEG